MTAGVIHEINNPMTVIRSISQQVRANDNKPIIDGELISFADKIDDMTYRVQRIISGLKVIAHKENHKLEDHRSLVKLIKESIMLTKEKSEENAVEVKISPFPEDWKIWCDRVQITQIFINLINNAIDEVHDKYDKPWINFSVREKGKFYEVCITDCGPGIPKKVQRDLFTAFVTTKKVGKGTGLGLSISKNIAKLHNGDLYIDNRMENTTFVAKFFKDHEWVEAKKEGLA